MSPVTPTRTLSTAEQRRESLIAAAIPIFAKRGYHAAATLEIAKAAGISQAYLFRLFPTKVDLFVAVCGVATERMLRAFDAAADEAGPAGADRLEAMGKAYDDLLERDRDVLLIQLHSQVAAGDERKIRTAMQRTFRELHRLVGDRSGASDEELRPWFAHGMLCNVMAAIDAEHVDEPWARALTGC